MITRHMLGRVAASGLALGCTFGLAAAPIASAADGVPTTTTASRKANPERSNPEVVKAACIRSTDKRLSVVAHDAQRVQEATGAPTAVRAELASQLEGVTANLDSSKAAISAAETTVEVRKACHEMVASTRVSLYSLKTRAVVAESRAAKIKAKAPKVEQRIERAISTAAKRGIPADKVTDAEHASQDLRAQAAAAASHIDGAAASLLPITPAQVNDHSADQTISAAKANLKSAREAWKRMRGDLVTIRTDLKKAR